MRTSAVSDCVSMYLSLAEAYAARTSFVDARNVVNEALRLAPNDQRLLDYRTQIDQMSAASGGTPRRWARG
jgi:hypothetical protein